MRVGPSELLGHFVLGRSLPIEPDGWHRRRLDGWTLLHEPGLPASPLLDTGGSELGWLIGHPIDLATQTVVSGSVRAPVDGSALHQEQAFERWLYGLAGRFAAILLRPMPVLYPDGGATLPVLFDPGLECAASSPFLLASPDGSVPDSPLVDRLAVYDTGGWFTLGATSHANASLLLANHALDLTSWEQSRHWPLRPFDCGDTDALVERVATTLERTLAAVAATGRPNVGITAGGDSRAFVACARPAIDRFRFFTAAFPDEFGAADAATARSLARRFDLNHRVLLWREPSPSDIERFMYRTGCLVGERRGREAARTYDQLGGGEAYVSGVGDASVSRWSGHGGMARVSPDARSRPDDLLTRFRIPTHPELLRRAVDWLAGLPAGLDEVDVLSLFYYEMRLSAWGGPLTTAYPHAYTFTVYPYLQRSILDIALQLPWQYRRDGRLREDVIASRWPEMLEIPFNRLPFRVSIRRDAHAARMGLGRTRLGRGLRRVAHRFLPLPCYP